MNFLTLLRFEFRSLFGDPTVKLTVVVATLLYLMLYPTPYLSGVATEQPIVVVDHDQTSLSRQVIRHADASSQISVVAKRNSAAAAKQLIESGEARGMLIIPYDFMKDLYLGKGATLSYSGDASYFLIYGAVVKGLVLTGMEAGKNVQRLGTLAHGASYQEMQLSLNPIKLNSVATYNPTLSYNPYLVPALLLLILHQTMLIALGTIGAGQWHKKGYWSRVSAIQLVCTRMATFFFVYSLLSALYVGWGYAHYGVTLLADLSDVLLLMIPYLLAVSALGIALSAFFENRERPTQVFLLMGMPIIFTAGFVWPTMLIPDVIVHFSQLIPAIPVTNAMLKLNQMGTSWSNIMKEWLQLWGLFVLFFAFAIYNVKKQQDKINAPQESAEKE